MVQVRKKTPATPRQAAACCGPLEDLLDTTLFRALGDPTRVRLFACVLTCARPCSVGEIAECCDVDLSVVSRHLQTLARAGLAEVARSGRTVRYSVPHGRVAMRMRRLADAIAGCDRGTASGSRRSAASPPRSGKARGRSRPPTA